LGRGDKGKSEGKGRKRERRKGTKGRRGEKKGKGGGGEGREEFCAVVSFRREKRWLVVREWLTEVWCA